MTTIKCARCDVDIKNDGVVLYGTMFCSDDCAQDYHVEKDCLSRCKCGAAV